MSNPLLFANQALFGSVGGGGGVTSISNSDGSITASPTTGNAVISLNDAHSNTFTAQQIFTGVGNASTADGTGQPAIFNGTATPVASNMVGIAIQKSGTDEVLIGINKNSVTGSIPANALYFSSYTNSSSLCFGRGNSAGAPDFADIFISSTGNVGIGTTDPQSILCVQDPNTGNPVLTLDTGADQSGKLSFTDDGSENAYLSYYGVNATPDSQLRLWVENNFDMTFGTNDTERMRIDSSGNVGIGTTTPAAKLDVQGVGRFTTTSGSILQLKSGSSLLADFKNDGYGQFEVNLANKFIFSDSLGNSTYQFTPANGSFAYAPYHYRDYSHEAYWSGFSLGWTPGNTNNTSDVSILRSAANTLQIGDGSTGLGNLALNNMNAASINIGTTTNFSIGNAASASGGSALAFGDGTAASGPSSVAIGAGSAYSGYPSANAGGDGSVALGSYSYTDPSAISSVAIGSGSAAYAQGSIAIGGSVTTGTGGAVAIGPGALSGGQNSLAISGQDGEAYGDFSTCIATSGVAYGDYSTVIGAGGDIETDPLATYSLLLGATSNGYYINLAVPQSAAIILGTSGSLIVARPSANLTISAIQAGIDFSRVTDAMLIPTGTTGQRPATPIVGMLRDNSSIGLPEIYAGSQWLQVGHQSGSVSVTGTATTTFTVTIGNTQANTTYKVNVTPTSVLAAAVFYVNNKTTTTFDVVYLAGITGAVSFDWSLFP